jgi:hypothetical protein
MNKRGAKSSHARERVRRTARRPRVTLGAARETLRRELVRAWERYVAADLAAALAELHWPLAGDSSSFDFTAALERWRARMHERSRALEFWLAMRAAVGVIETGELRYRP